MFIENIAAFEVTFTSVTVPPIESRLKLAANVDTLFHLQRAILEEIKDYELH